MNKSPSLRGFSPYRLWAQLPLLQVSYLPDLVMFAAGIALFYGVVTVGRDWFSPFTPEVEISRSLLALPAYAGYSLLRITIAYVLSLIFALVYGYIAARNARAERFMVPLLDVLQSIPVLSFLPPVMLAMVALFPHPPTRCGDGRHPSNLHRPGVEHGLQLLRFAQKHSQRDARGRKDLRLQLVAALH
jgi:hypothetical protein